MDYHRRIIDDELDEILGLLPAVVLEGPRGVGKTATAERRAKTAWYLDDPAHRAIVEADPSHVLHGEPPTLIDEWQRVPAVWDAVRRAVDRGAKPGSFLLTGSAAPIISPAHSGAGRIVQLRMRPMSLPERGVTTPTVSLKTLLSGTAAAVTGTSSLLLTDYLQELVATGFPAIRRLSGRALRLQLDSYLLRIIDRDMEEQGVAVRRRDSLHRWLAAYAAATGTTASFEKIRDAATAGQGDKPAKTTTQPYRDVLERLWLLDELAAWSPTRNRLQRLSLSPKHYLADPGLAVRLLGLDATALLSGNTPETIVHRDGALLGALFEALVVLGIRVCAAAAEARVYHFRQHSGRHEVDCIVEREDGRVLAIEVKLRAAIGDEDVHNLLWLREQLGSDLIDAVVINTGPAAYRRTDGIAVVPAALLGP